jgi:uncharacterized membrane protein YeiB
MTAAPVAASRRTRNDATNWSETTLQVQGRFMVIFALLVGLGLVAMDVRELSGRRRSRTG